MRKRLAIIVSLIGIAALGALFFSSCEPHSVHYHGKSLKQWAAQLRASDSAARDEATAAIKALGPKALPGLIHLLQNKDTGVRRLAWAVAKRLPRRPRAWFFRDVNWPDPNEACIQGARGLGILGPDAQPAIPQLARALRSPAPGVGIEAAAALAHIGKASVPVLLEALGDKNPQVRHWAVYALGELGPVAESAVPQLIGMLSESDEGLRASVVYSLSRIGPPGLSALLNTMTQGGAQARQSAAKVLLEYYGSLRQAMPALDKIPMRTEALQSLGAVQRIDLLTVALAARALRDPDPHVRLAGIAALAQSNTQIQVILPPLLKCLKDQSPQVRESAVRALAQIGAVSSQAISALNPLLQDNDETVRKAAQEALRAIQPKPPTQPGN